MKHLIFVYYAFAITLSLMIVSLILTYARYRKQLKNLAKKNHSHHNPIEH